MVINQSNGAEKRKYKFIPTQLMRIQWFRKGEINPKD